MALVQKKLAEGGAHREFCTVLYKSQLRRGKHLLHEDPAGASSWKEEKIEELLQHPSVHAAILPRVLQMLGEPDPRARMLAKAALLPMSHEALWQSLNHAGGERSEVWAALAVTGGLTGQPAEKLGEAALPELLQHVDNGVARAALALIARLSQQHQLPHLATIASLLGHADTGIRDEAKITLMAVQPALKGLLSSEDKAVQVTAMAALAVTGELAKWRPLALFKHASAVNAVLSHVDWGVRMAAKAALRALDRDTLRGFLSSDTPGAAHEAEPEASQRAIAQNGF